MDANKLLKGITGSGLLGGLAGGAVTGALLSNKSARKTATKALKVGGIAALGGLAFKAWQHYQSDASQPPVPEPDANFENLAAADAEGDAARLVVVRAMIAAALADGHLSAAEQTRVISQIAGSDLSTGERALLLNELNAPVPMAELISAAKTPALALEVYLASAMATDRSCVQGQQYLEQLAQGLQLEPTLVSALQQQVQGHQQAA